MEYPWLTSYEPQVNKNLDYPEMMITQFLQDAAALYPHRPAVSFFGTTISYRKLLDYANRFAAVLHSLHVMPGDRVALMLPNVPQYVISYYGALLAGAVVVQTNPLYVERELMHHLKDSGSETIVCLDLVYGRVRNVRVDVQLKHVIVTSVRDFLPFAKKMLYPLVQKQSGAPVPPKLAAGEALSFIRLLAGASPAHSAYADASPDDTAVLQYTGGTTGTAKGVMLTHRNLIANVIQCQSWMYRNEKAGETILTAVPLFHVYGMTICMNYAVSMALRMVLIPRFDPGLLLKTIHREKPTIFPGAPTMYVALLNHPNLHKYNMSSINCCISGSAALPMQVKQSFEQRTGGKLVEGYGLSEASPVTHVNPIWGDNVSGSIGLPLPDTEAKIVEPLTGEVLEPHQIGELTVKGPQVMKGYWHQPGETAAVLQEGWLRTGDMAYRDERGYFFIVDRKKEMINAGGLKVYPRDVEEVLYGHPGVLEAAVIGIPDAYRGETVKAYVVRKPESIVSVEELEEYCRKRLAVYKVPKQIEFRSQLPKSIVGKVLRRALVEEERAKE